MTMVLPQYVHLFITEWLHLEVPVGPGNCAESATRESFRTEWRRFADAVEERLIAFDKDNNQFLSLFFGFKEPDALCPCVLENDTPEYRSAKRHHRRKWQEYNRRKLTRWRMLHRDCLVALGRIHVNYYELDPREPGFVDYISSDDEGKSRRKRQKRRSNLLPVPTRRSARIRKRERRRHSSLSAARTQP